MQAFVSLLPSYSSQRVSFDLIRYSERAPRDTSAFLFSRLITHLESIHCSEFDMGLAPLSGLEQLRGIDQRGLHLLYLYTNRWFGFKGLRRFKAKFKPTWEPRYAVYQGSRITVPGLIVELNRLMRHIPAQK
jgi:phosphatidylglycerol lysyltransferase